MILLGKGLLVLALVILAVALYTVITVWVKYVKKQDMKDSVRLLSLAVTTGSVVAMLGLLILVQVST